MTVFSNKKSDAQQVVLCGQNVSTTLLEGLLKARPRSADSGSQKEKPEEQEVFNLLDFSNPAVGRVFSRYMENGIDRAFNPDSLMLENAIKKKVVEANRVHPEEDKTNEMQELIAVLKAAQKVKNPEIELVILDTSYINSIVRENGKIKDAVEGLHSALSAKKIAFEIIITRGVYEELITQLNDSKKDEYGRRIMTSEALDELHELVYGGRKGEKALISLEHYRSTEESRKALSAVLKKRNRKGNARCGAGDTSIMECIKDWSSGMKDVSFDILTLDSDLKKLMRGCGMIRVLKTLTSGKRRRKADKGQREICLETA